MPTLRRLAFLCAAVPALSGCFTGERPSYSEPALGGETGTSTGDPNVDTVLQKLEMANRVVFTAEYTITRLVGPVVTAAQVTQDATRRSVTIGSVRFLSVGSAQTCDLPAATCEPDLIDARVSDSGVTHEFAGEAAARRLRIAASRTTAETAGRMETIAGYPSACVDVPLGAGTETYCANDLGVISRWVAADVTVELTAVTPAATEELFATVL